MLQRMNEVANTPREFSVADLSTDKQSCIVIPNRGSMARGGGSKAATQLVKLVSSAQTGYYYVKPKNTRKLPQKLQLNKYALSLSPYRPSEPRHQRTGLGCIAFEQLSSSNDFFCIIIPHNYDSHNDWLSPVLFWLSVIIPGMTRS